jgi:type IV secretion system protein VirB8
VFTKVDRSNFNAYLAEARFWETSRVEQADRSRRTAWSVAIGASSVAFIAVVAVAGLTPLKQTELKILRVNNTTGLVDVITEIPDGRSTYDETVNKYFAQLYLRFREGYSKALAEEYYYDVGLMSDSSEQRRYFDWFNPKNPVSPLNIYGDTARVKIQVKSVSFIKRDVALLRYTKEVERGPSERPATTHWAATMVFKYSGAPMAERDRAINPLGFQVVEYRNDPDSLISEPAPVSLPMPPAPQHMPHEVGFVPPPAFVPVPVAGQVPAIQVVP